MTISNHDQVTRADVMDMLDGVLDAAQQARVVAALEQDETLRRFAEQEQQLRKQLAALGGATAPAGLAQQLARQLRPASAGRWLDRGLAFAAGFAVTLGVGWLSLSPDAQPSGGGHGGGLQAQVLHLNANDIDGGNVVLNLQTDEFIGTATLKLILPDGVTFEGLPGERTFEWDTELFPGDNLVALPLHFAEDTAGGDILAELQYNDEVQLMWLRLDDIGV